MTPSPERPVVPGTAEVPIAEVDTTDLGFLTGLTTAPCFRETALYSIGGSGALAALHFMRNRDAMRSAEIMVKSGCAFSILHWVICRQRFYRDREATYDAIETQKARLVSKRIAAAKKGREEAGKGPEPPPT